MLVDNIVLFYLYFYDPGICYMFNQLNQINDVVPPLFISN